MSCINMKYLFFAALILITAASCNPLIYPMPGMDYTNISNFKTQKSYDSAWAEVNRFLVQEGCVIKTADKDGGLIETDKYDFSKHVSFVKDKKPMDPAAWVAITYTTNKGGFGDAPFLVYAHWTVHIKRDGTGSAIQIDLSKVDASVTKQGKSSYHPELTYYLLGQSTGVFEKKLRFTLDPYVNL